ncbi:hypothetical protein [Acidovorax sp. SUPP3334]|uniref:hypothetical protein n=1 Tax=Acidovorax sp. SUPP3334 TaxID=2920881 RepID=UPI0023DE4A92|nr:hypothetical protein [Acidovorax sp. SUPP3334]GKT27077.1 hypothetical protein AVHM3334_22730 [Acidovorax sp. SUPP3334]
MTKKFDLTRLGFLAAAAIFISSGAHAASTSHRITITSSSQAVNKWSVYADLYDGKGKKVYHWQEVNKKPGALVNWNYNDGHDGGWLNIWIDPSGAQRASYLKVPLDKNPCYHITEPIVGSVSTVRKCDN